MTRIEVESSFRFLYLRRGEDQLYVTYAYDDLKGLMEEEGVEYCYLIVDLKGENHMLLISPKLVDLKDDRDKKKIATDLYQAYWDMCYRQREINALFANINS